MQDVLRNMSCRYPTDQIQFKSLYAVATEFSGEETDMLTQTTPVVSTVHTDDSAATARRTVAALGLLAIAMIHLIDLPGKFEEGTYLAVGFIGLIIASVLLAERLIRRGGRRVWTFAALLSAAIIAGYVISRTVGLPGGEDDIGNWLEPLGVASLFVEGLVVLLSLSALTRPEQLASH
jgi:hypothetical protein